MTLKLENSTVYFREQFVPFDQANLSVASAPMLYGLSVYTVFPVVWNDTDQRLYAFRLEDHFARLQNSAKIMNFHNFLENWTFKKFEQTMQELLKRNKVQEDALVRITLFVDEIMSGTRMSGLKHGLAAFVYPTPRLLPPSGASLCVSSWMRTPDNAIPSRAKINGSYANASLMKNEALEKGYDDAISLDSHGHVAESTVANFFMVRSDTLITPSGSTDLLEGITRSTIFALAKKLDIACEQRSIDRSELYLADEAFLSGSSVRIAPVISIDNRQLGKGKPGAITMQLVKLYDQVSRGSVSDFADWRTAVAT